MTQRTCKKLLRLGRILLSAWIVVPLFCLSSSCKSGSQPTNSALAEDTDGNPELALLYAEDQHDRESWATLGPEDWKELTKRDRQRRLRVIEMMTAGALEHAIDYYHAATIFQHGETPDDILKAHVLATIGAFKGNDDARRKSAQSLDRFLHWIDRPQLFGTNHQREGEGPWTDEPYDRSLPQSIRTEYRVLSVEEEAQMLEELNRMDR